MPDQLIFSGVSGGVAQGGLAAVVKSPTLLPALETRLQQLSYHYPSAVPGAETRPTSCYRILDIQNLRHYVLTRIKEAGLDDTGRPTFIAHHLIFSLEEVTHLLAQTEGWLTPPQIFLRWSGWVNILWKGEPRLLDPLRETNLLNIHKDCSPARRWDYFSGDAAKAFGLLAPDFAGHISLDDGGIPEANALELLAESLQMLEARDATKFRRGSTWDVTFTSNLQPDDALADFFWPLTRVGSRGYERLAANRQPVEALAKIKRQSATEDEIAFARTGRVPLKITRQPILPPVPLKPGDKLTMKVEARCLPASPISYSWCKLDLKGEPEQPPIGLGVQMTVAVGAKGFRVVASARNREGKVVWSEPVNVQVGASSPLASAEANAVAAKRKRKMAVALLCLLALGALGGWYAWYAQREPEEPEQPPTAQKPPETNAPAVAQAVTNAMEATPTPAPEPAPAPAVTPPPPSPTPAPAPTMPAHQHAAKPTKTPKEKDPPTPPPKRNNNTKKKGHKH